MSSTINDDGWRISDAIWEEMERLLPPRKSHPLGCHNPRVPDRKAMDAILLVLRTGCPWRALNRTELCSHSSAHRRLSEWSKAGVFMEFHSRGLLETEMLKKIRWDRLPKNGENKEKIAKPRNEELPLLRHPTTDLVPESSIVKLPPIEPAQLMPAS